MELPYWGHLAIIALCTVNAISCVAAVILNGLAMFIIKKSPSLHKPAFVLLFSLALTDFFTGFFVQPLYIWRLVNRLRIREASGTAWLKNFESTLRTSSVTVTVFLLTAVSFDRFLALHMKTRYPLIVTFRRTIVVSVLLWIAGTAVVVVGTVIRNNSYGLRLLFSLPICLFFALVLFIANSRKLVRLQRTVANHRNTGQPSLSGNQQEQTCVDIARYSKILTSLKYVFGAFVVCYLPAVVTVVVVPLTKSTASDNWAFLLTPIASTISLTNSAVNPFLYYWKIPYLRSEFKRVFKL